MPSIDPVEFICAIGVLFLIIAIGQGRSSHA